MPFRSSISRLAAAAFGGLVAANTPVMAQDIPVISVSQNGYCGTENESTRDTAYMTDVKTHLMASPIWQRLMGQYMAVKKKNQDISFAQIYAACGVRTKGLPLLATMVDFHENGVFEHVINLGNYPEDILRGNQPIVEMEIVSTLAEATFNTVPPGDYLNISRQSARDKTITDVMNIAHYDTMKMLQACYLDLKSGGQTNVFDVYMERSPLFAGKKDQCRAVMADPSPEKITAFLGDMMKVYADDMTLMSLNVAPPAEGGLIHESASNEEYAAFMARIGLQDRAHDIVNAYEKTYTALMEFYKGIKEKRASLPMPGPRAG